MNNNILQKGKQSLLRQIAKKSSLNYKELNIIVDEEMNNENIIGNKQKLTIQKRGQIVKDDFIEKEINEEQFFTFPRESVNYITYMMEQNKKTQEIRINAQSYTYEYQIISNQKTLWTKLRIFVKKALYIYRIYLNKKQFYPKKKELKDFFSEQQITQYQKQIIKDVDREQACSDIHDSNLNDNPLDLDIELFMQQSRKKIILNKNNANSEMFPNIY